MKVPYPRLRGIGRFEADHFVPELWRPRVPNPAYVRSRPDDTFWAARRLMALPEDLIRAAVKAGRYTDPESERYLVETLLERRARIARAFLVPVNPIVDPRLSSDGRLTFSNAAVDHAGATAPAGYRAVWHRFDNDNGAAERLGATEGPASGLQAPDGLPSTPGAFVRVDLSAIDGAHPSWSAPVHAYFRLLNDGWKLVGFERLPDAPPMRPGLVGAEPMPQ
jgi:hypothetical protein